MKIELFVINSRGHKGMISNLLLRALAYFIKKNWVLKIQNTKCELLQKFDTVTKYLAGDTFFGHPVHTNKKKLNLIGFR